MSPELTVISLGAGVQSTTLALLAAHGEITPMPDCAVFADTGWEPKAVYAHLGWLCSGVLPFPVEVVSNGNIRHMLTRTEPSQNRFVMAPFYLVNPDGSVGMGRRQCTHEYKLKPLRWTYRKLLGKERKDRIATGAVENWLGISYDEVMRMKDSGIAWCTNRWPLVEQHLTRADCVRWLAQHHYPIPAKSSCIGCPYHNDAHWREIRDRTPEEFADAVAVEQIVNATTGRVKAQQFMHRSCLPLDQVDLSTPSDWGQLELFNNECEGMCGV